MNKRDVGIPVDQVVGESRKVSKRIDIGRLADAVVDGKLTVVPGTLLIIMRSSYKKGEQIMVPTFCRVKSIEKDGYVCTYDETRQQVFGFNANDKSLPVIKVWKEE